MLNNYLHVLINFVSVKKHSIYILLLIFSTTVFAQVPPNYRYVKTWKVSDRFAVVDSVSVDSAHLNFQDANPIDRLSIANSYNGNLGSPIQSKLYFSRPNEGDFIFSNAYSPYITSIKNTTFYNTKTPYSTLNYLSGGTTYREAQQIKFLFTANANKKLNFGTTLDFIYANGEYANQGVKRFSGSFFGSYNGSHYNATGAIFTNNLNNYENGGIAKSTDITNPIGIASKDIQTNLVGYSNYKSNEAFYNHQYILGFDRKVQVSKDSVRIDYIPVTRFMHTFKLEDLRKRYFEIAKDTVFYPHTYLPGKQTNDSSALQTLTNNFSVSMEEEFNKWMQFGLTAFVENEVQKYTFNKDSLLDYRSFSSTKVGGILSKQRGDRFKYNVLGELTLLGYKAGNFMLNGTAGGFLRLWKDSISLVANGYIRSDQPTYLLQHYESNHFRWDNSFESTYRTRAGGLFSIPTRSFSLDVGVENITRLIYFNNFALPTQYTGNIQVLSAKLKQDFHLWKFALENTIVGQVSSHPTILPLPELALYHNLYYDDLWFDVLSMQLGASLSYHSAYYAPTYMPAIGQFYTQSSTLIGNYPLVNVYLNFHLKRTRFFAEYYNVNQLFMKGSYFSMPNYPLNPAIFKVGASWSFYD